MGARRRALHAAALLGIRSRPSEAPSCGARSEDRWDPVQRQVCAGTSDDDARELRRSYRCACGEWGRKPGRERLNDPEYDIGERTLRAVEKATGERWHTCPWQALADPFVGQVFRAYPHWKRGELGLLYGGDAHVPAVLIDGCATYDAALNRVQMHDLEADRRRREQEDADRERTGDPFGGRLHHIRR